MIGIVLGIIIGIIIIAAFNAWLKADGYKPGDPWDFENKEN
jgi:hypothetical protein